MSRRISSRKRKVPDVDKAVADVRGLDTVTTHALVRIGSICHSSHRQAPRSLSQMPSASHVYGLLLVILETQLCSSKVLLKFNPLCLRQTHFE